MLDLRAVTSPTGDQQGRRSAVDRQASSRRPGGGGLSCDSAPSHKPVGVPVDPFNSGSSGSRVLQCTNQLSTQPHTTSPPTVRPNTQGGNKKSLSLLSTAPHSPTNRVTSHTTCRASVDCALSDPQCRLPPDARSHSSLASPWTGFGWQLWSAVE